MCHGELARRRPAPKYLTAFYLWMSAGGMIGGIAVGLIAPHTFNWVAEYPILIALAVLCRPGLALPKNLIVRYGIFFGAIAVGGGRAGLVGPIPASIVDRATFNWVVGALLIVSVLFWRAPLPFAAHRRVRAARQSRRVRAAAGRSQVRSFFGIFKVAESSDGRFRLLSARHHAARRPAHPRRRRAAGRPAARAPALLLRRLRHRADHRRGTRAQAPAPIRYRRGRAWHRHARLPRRAGRYRALLRDRSGGDPHRDAIPRTVHASWPNAGRTCRSRSAMRGSRSPRRRTEPTT